MSKTPRHPADVGLEFRPGDYMSAALEHAETLRTLYGEGFFVMAIYVSGLAVESMFRAYRMGVDPQFDSRHNLRQLAKDSKFEPLVPWKMRGQYLSELSVVCERWSSLHRYRTAKMVLRRFAKQGLCRGIRGDALKENARQCVNASLSLVGLGGRLWKA
jgi:hypothetical protein